MAMPSSYVSCLRFSSSVVGRWPKNLKAEDPKIIRAQRANKVIDVGVQSVDGRRNEDDGGDADRDAENGEPGAQLILASVSSASFTDSFESLRRIARVPL